jgi:hypothetical protein
VAKCCSRSKLVAQTHHLPDREATRIGNSPHRSSTRIGDMGGAGPLEEVKPLGMTKYILLLCLMHMAILSQQLTMVQTLENGNIIPGAIGVSLSTWGIMTGLPSYATFALASVFISGEMADNFNRPRLLGIVLVIIAALTTVQHHTAQCIVKCTCALPFWE